MGGARGDGEHRCGWCRVARTLLGERASGGGEERERGERGAYRAGCRRVRHAYLTTRTSLQTWPGASVALWLFPVRQTWYAPRAGFAQTIVPSACNVPLWPGLLEREPGPVVKDELE